MAGLKNKKSSKSDIAKNYKKQLESIKNLKDNLAVNLYFNSLKDSIAPDDANAYKKIGYDEKKLGAETFATKSWKTMKSSATLLGVQCAGLTANPDDKKLEDFKDSLENFAATLYKVSTDATKNSKKRLAQKVL